MACTAGTLILTTGCKYKCIFAFEVNSKFRIITVVYSLLHIK